MVIRWACRNLKTTAAVTRMMTGEGPSWEDTALVNPRPVEAPSHSTEARVVRLSSGPPLIPKKGGKVQIRQKEGAQDVGAAPDSPEPPVVRRKTPIQQDPEAYRGPSRAHDLGCKLSIVSGT